jgi:DNA polymerase III sliding clamp (beta) subunit (PCNA family)
MAKIVVKRTELLSSLKKVWPTVGKKSTVDLYKCFAFSADKVSSFDGNQGTITKCLLDRQNMIVNAEAFMAVVEDLDEDISLEQVGGTVVVKSGKHRTSLALFDSDGFPQILPADAEQFCKAKNLIEAVDHLLFTVSDDKGKPELRGVAFCHDYAYSCDNKRVTRYKLDSPADGYSCLPTAALEVLKKLGQPDYLYKAGNGLVGFLRAEDKLCYMTRSIANLFPADHIDKVFESAPKYPVELPECLDAAIKKCTKLVKESTPVKLEYANGVLVVSARVDGAGNSTETIEWKCDLPSFQFGANPKHMREALAYTRTVDLFGFEQNDARGLRFVKPGFDHMMGLWSLS